VTTTAEKRTGIQLKSARELDVMAAGGRILARTLAVLRDAVHPGVSTGELDRIGEEFIRSHAGATPAFKGLYGFPGSVCTSVNQEIVHGIPSRKRVLADGDIVSLDVGVKYEGLYTDSAITVAVGAVSAADQRLLDVTEASLRAGSPRPWWATTSATSATRCRRWSSAPGSAWCASWWATAWATARTRIRRCPITASRSGARSCCQG
jgi:hypothetical protein